MEEEEGGGGEEEDEEEEEEEEADSHDLQQNVFSGDNSVVDLVTFPHYIRSP